MVLKVPSVEDREMFDSVLRVQKASIPSDCEEERTKLGSVLRDCRRLLPSLAPAVGIPALIWASGGDLVLPGSKLSLFLVCALFFWACVFSVEDVTPLGKFLISLSYTALLSFVAGQIVSRVVSMFILYLDFLLAAFFLGIALAQRSNGRTERAFAVANAVSIDQTARCMWFATPSLLLLGTMIPIPKSDLVASAVLCLCLILYCTFVGFRLGLEIILTLKRLRVAAFSAFLAYRLRFHAYYDPGYWPLSRWRSKMLQKYSYRKRRLGEHFDRRNSYLPCSHPPVTVRGDQRSMLTLSLVLAVIAKPLLRCSSGDPVLATRTLSMFIICHLFCCTVYYSTESTPLANIFLSLTYAWLAACFAGTLLTGALGMVLMLIISLLAAAVFGVTLADHRQRNGTETAALVAVANVRVYRKEDRLAVYGLIGLMALFYAPRLIWNLHVGRPAFEVAVGLFGFIGFLQVLHITIVIGWLNGAVFTSAAPVFSYFASVLYVFAMAYLLTSEIVALAVLWLCFLASTTVLGYYSKIQASYEVILNKRAPVTAASGGTGTTEG